MRPGAEYPMAHVPAALSAGAPPRSPWHTPVPYLFGGLGAMLGLIALSLVALACSYWNLFGGPVAGPGADDQADGEKPSAAGPAGEWQQGHVVVIMAGDERPTFLATPASTTRQDREGGAENVSDATACCATRRSEERKIAAGTRVAGARPAGYEDDVQSRGEQASSSAGSVIT